MRFIKLAVTHYDPGTARPAIGADDIWINLDQVTTITEHLGSNSFDTTVRDGHQPVEHYPCLQLTTSDGTTHLISLGTYPDQASALDAIHRFLPTLTQNTPDPFDLADLLP